MESGVANGLIASSNPSYTRVDHDVARAQIDRRFRLASQKDATNRPDKLPMLSLGKTSCAAMPRRPRLSQLPALRLRAIRGTTGPSLILAAASGSRAFQET